MRFCFLLVAALFLAGCSSHRAPPPNPRLSDSIAVIAGLNDQLHNWGGTPYRYGGMTRRGIDCSGFVLLTFRDQFALQLPRETRQRRGVLHHTDDQFIHASTSRGVVRSSLNNVYWRKNFWQARRI